MTSRSRHLILFARRPQLGRGKRRLARDIGDVAAVSFERAMLGMMLRRLGRDRRWRLRLAVTPDRGVTMPRTRRRGATAQGQGRGDLGQRMRRALAACRPGPAVLIGTDVPELRASHIAAAFRLLGRHDIVFGPARDGGFWLVGVPHSPAIMPPFGPVRWSTSHTLADTIAGLPRRLSVGFAATLDDVDSGDAYRRLKPDRGF